MAHASLNESPIHLSDGHVENGRSVLSRADAAMGLIGYSGDALDSLVTERPLGETHHTLREAQEISRALRELAEEFDVARNALRESLEQTIRDHDKRLALESESEHGRMVPASASRTDRADAGSSRAR